MKKRWLGLTTLLTALTGVMSGAPILTLNPGNGIISGTPGSTIGWGFTLSNDVGFIVPSQVVFCEGAFNSGCTNTYGTFTDFAAQFQINVVGTTVVQPFNNATHQGIGSFTINANAPIGAQDIGTIFLVYDTFSCNILDSACNPTQTGFSQQLSASARVNVVGTPEPASFGLAAIGFLALVAATRLKLYANSFGGGKHEREAAPSGRLDKIHFQA